MPAWAGALAGTTLPAGDPHGRHRAQAIDPVIGGFAPLALPARPAGPNRCRLIEASFAEIPKCVANTVLSSSFWGVCLPT